jgi:hypothetical protein
MPSPEERAYYAQRAASARQRAQAAVDPDIRTIFKENQCRSGDASSALFQLAREAIAPRDRGRCAAGTFAANEHFAHA